jgi:hypothetical protein
MLITQLTSLEFTYLKIGEKVEPKNLKDHTIFVKRFFFLLLMAILMTIKAIRVKNNLYTEIRV